ncbi:hypothetical protein LCGC14_0687360 [marine sediment metagenome]|uniref:Uncharacterized protein n=1 Tax=marine sediment metagenome TaxID=412755 RepID=A0A0F9QRB4_9ZZZZ
MPTEQTHQSVAALMDGFLEKVAEEEKAASNLDLAGDAKSKHPSAQADDKTRPAAEGARSAENEADVRKTTPNTINDPGTQNPEGGSKKPTDTQGTVSMSSDVSAAGNVDTPKNQHSMAANSATGPGMEGKNDKAATDDVASVVKLGNDLLAQIALLTKQSGDEDPAAAASGDGGAAEGAAADTGAADAGKADGGQADAAPDKEATEKASQLFKEAAEKYPEDVEAGYVAAAMLAQQLGLISDDGTKTASDDELTQFIATVRKQAAEDAAGYVEFLKGYQVALSKGAQPVDPAALAALGNAGDGEALPGAGEEGGEAPGGAGLGGLGGLEGLGAEGQDAEGQGAEGLGGEEQGGEGEVGDEEAIAAIAEALDEAGVTPEQLAQAVAEAEGGGGEEGEEAGMAGMEGAEGAEGAGLPPGLLGGAGAPAGLEAAASGARPATKQASSNARALTAGMVAYLGK